MYSKITLGIRVSVIPEYDIRNSFPSESRFLFRYNILIENLASESIKLLGRKWLIYDTGFGFSEVSGDGVIGMNPELNPAEQFSYFSNVILRSGIGYMSGTYIFLNTITKETMEVEVPRFELFSEVLCN